MNDKIETFCGVPLVFAENGGGRMAVTVHGDDLVFGSGRKEFANCGIIGINPDGDVFGGYDDGFSPSDWTDEERRELADYMIGLWIKFGAGDEYAAWRRYDRWRDHGDDKETQKAQGL